MGEARPDKPVPAASAVDAPLRRRRLRPATRVVLVATAALAVLQVGQLYVLVERQAGATAGASSFAYVLGCLFLIPSAVSLTAAVAWQIRHRRRTEGLLGLLCALNVLLALHLGLFAASPCGWQAIIGLRVAGCGS